MKGVAFVAVGEKHTLAAQFARRPTRMRVDGAIGDAFVADDAGRLDEGRLDERLGEWAAAADAFAQNASDDDEVFALDDACRSDSDEDAYDTDAGSGSRRRVAAVPSLRDVAGALVAERVATRETRRTSRASRTILARARWEVTVARWLSII